MALFHYKLMRFFQNSSLYPPQELRQCWLCRHTVAYTNKHADELQNAPQLKWPRIRSESRRDASLSERIINAHHTYKHTPALSGSHSLSHSSPSSFQFTLSLPVTSLTFFFEWVSWYVQTFGGGKNVFNGVKKDCISLKMCLLCAKYI